MRVEKNGIEFLDLITLLSFCISLQNLDENLSQSDLQDTASRSEKKQSTMIEDIHKHLAVQDRKLDAIIDVLRENGGVFHER